MADPAARAAAPTAGTPFRERLDVPVWWWVASLAVTSVLAYEVHLGTPRIPVWLPLLVTVPLTVWAMRSLGGMRVDVGPDAGGVPELRVGQAHLPISVVSRVGVVPPTATRSALGPALDPAAFVQHRSWVRPMVLVVLDDPDDPTPYWLVSTRHPDRLVQALVAAGAPAPA